MPLPNPKPYEKKNEFIKRFMSDNTMVKEFPKDQRYAIALDKWEEFENKKFNKGAKFNTDKLVKKEKEFNFS